MESIERETDKIQFTKLYTSTYKKMITAALRIVGNQSDAEDVVQKSYLRLIENYSMIRNRTEQEAEGFLLVIVRNMATDYYRRGKRKSKIDQSMIKQHRERESDSAEEAYLQKQSEIDLLDAVKQLPKSSADILVLRYYYGFPDGEISALLHLSVNAVRIRICRARKLLIKRMEGD